MLITLGKIGVVSAITIPNLIANYQKQQTALKVKKFYSTVSNASSLLNIEEPNWISEIYNSENNITTKEWVEKYLVKQINMKEDGTFPDGSKANFWFNWGKLFITYCTERKHCTKSNNEVYDGKKGFLFIIDTTGSLKPYCNVNSSMEYLVTSCNTKSIDQKKSHCCSAVLLKNNWEFPDNYLWNF